MIILNKKYWEIKKSKDKGHGIFAKITIPKGTVIGDYTGTVVRTKDVDLTQESENMYLMYYNDQASILPDITKPGIHLLNHSCNPNCWVFTLRGHTLFFVLREINPGEEVTIDYLLAPKSEFCNPCTHECKCGSTKCRGSFHLPESKFNKWRVFQDSIIKKDKRARITYGKTLKLLSTYPTKIPDSYIKSIPPGLR